MIPRETIDRIYDLTRIEEVIGEFVSIRKAGARFIACCPFHNEKTPSFSINPSKSFYYCFGCHKGGSAVTFLMEHEGMTYVEALRYLANKYNVEIVEEEQSEEAKLAQHKKESLYIASEYAANFYKSQLQTQYGRALGYAYFHSRGMEDSTIEKFGLGWSPHDSMALINAARADGYKDEYFEESGIYARGDKGIYDRFHDRVIFPIYSDSGRVIAFSGRTLRSDAKEKGIAKYVNSKESDIYKKNSVLYGLYQAKSSINKPDSTCILVEGNIDVISMHQLGLTNTVATCGTALNSEHVRKIKRYTHNLTIIFDGDSAGIKAALRSIDIVLKEDMNLRLVKLPDGQDPDDFCRKNTLEQVQDYLKNNSMNFIRFRFSIAEEELNDPIQRAKLINSVADDIALVSDPVMHSVYIDECASVFETDRNAISRRVQETSLSIAKEEWKARNAKVARESQLPPANEDGVIKVPGADMRTVSQPVVVKETPLTPLEKDIVGFLLNYGTEPLKFNKDSEYYGNGEEFTVADFISEFVSSDNLVFSTEECRECYELYLSYYDEGFETDDIIRKIMQSDNAGLTSLVGSLTEKQYELSETLKKNLSVQSEWLVTEVPKTLILYRVKLLEAEEKSLQKRLNEPGADIIAIMQEMNEKRRMILILNNKTGRK